MKKIQLIIWCAILSVCLLSVSCKKKTPPPVSERIAKAWSASTVQEGSTVVYTKGGASNVKPGYGNFRLDLNQSGSVTYTEFDGTRFSGQWEVSGDNKLILKNLNPQPTGSGGVIEFTITDLQDGSVVLTRTTASVKTGGTVNKYTLSNP